MTRSGYPGRTKRFNDTKLEAFVNVFGDLAVIVRRGAYGASITKTETLLLMVNSMLDRRTSNGQEQMKKRFKYHLGSFRQRKSELSMRARREQTQRSCIRIR